MIDSAYNTRVNSVTFHGKSIGATCIVADATCVPCLFPGNSDLGRLVCHHLFVSEKERYIGHLSIKSYRLTMYFAFSALWSQALIMIQ